jgi:hypothetical protein
VRQADPLDEKIRKIQESIHDDDDRPSQVTVVVERGTKPPASTRQAHTWGKIAAAIGALGALGEVIHQIVKLLGGG